ncbi:uncharacterized protein [Nicotiana tomentosiformis]|uniref:uncharacterized protein n=1 Tax=Nicotiana tomentosiformis TaxID=4098 RepID=UPI00388C43D8
MVEAYESTPLMWHEFSVLFLEKFVPQTPREELRRQFEKLCHEGMSVTQYEIRFLKLAHHAVWLVPTERKRIRRFIDSLKAINYGLRFIMSREIMAGARFDEVVEIAIRQEMVRSQEHEEREAKSPHGSGGFNCASSGGQSHHNRGRPYMPTQMACPVRRGESASHGSYSARLGESSFSALPAQIPSCAPSVQGFICIGSF